MGYQQADGGIANYYPNFIIKQVNNLVWVIETKGREDLDDPRKWERLQRWCENATESNPAMIYRPLFVREEKWENMHPRNFGELVAAFG